MGNLEKRIKDYAREQGVKLVGVAGPERLDGPPSMDPSYTLRAKPPVPLAEPEYAPQPESQQAAIRATAQR